MGDEKGCFIKSGEQERSAWRGASILEDAVRRTKDKSLTSQYNNESRERATRFLSKVTSRGDRKQRMATLGRGEKERGREASRPSRLEAFEVTRSSRPSRLGDFWSSESW